MEVRKVPVRFQGLDYLQVPVVLIDRSFHILHFNNAFARLTQETDSVFPPGNLQEVFSGITQWLLAGEQLPDAAEILILRGLLHQATQRHYDLHVSLIDKNLDHLDGYSVICSDVTDSFEKVRQLTELGEHHKTFLENTNTGVIIHRNGKILYTNKRAEAIVAVPEGQTLVGMEIWQFVSKEFVSSVAARIKKMRDESQVVDPMEEHFIRMDGTTVAVEVFAFPVTYGGEFAIKTIITDISARKLAEQQLISSRRQYYTLVENLTDVVFQIDTDGKFCFLNATWESLTGFTQSETLGRSCFDFLQHPHNTEMFYQKVRKLLVYGLQEFHYDLLLNTKTGTQKFVEVSLRPIYEDKLIVGITGLIRDIHAKKLADLEVKKIQKTLKHQQQVLVSLTKEDSIINGELKEALETIAKLTAETLQANYVSIWQFNEDKTRLQCLTQFDLLDRCFSSEGVFNCDEMPVYFNKLLSERMIIADDVQMDDRLTEFIDIYLIPEQVISLMDFAISKGDRVWGVICIESRFSYHKWTLEDQAFGRSIADFLSLAFESSVLKSTQKALHEKEKMYRTLIEQATDAIIILDADDKFIEFNNSLCVLSGYSRLELSSLHLQDLIPHGFIQRGLSEAELPRRKDTFFGERIYVNKFGEERFAEISAVVFPDGKVQGIIRDITERKLQEKALRDSEARLELALKGADLGTWDFYIEGDVMVHNKRWAEMLGYYFENTVVNKQFWEKFVHPDDVAVAYTAFQKHLNGETPFYESSIRMLASNGEWRWIADRGKVVEWDSAGKPIRASGIHQDITELKLNQQQILQQRKFMQEIINAIPNLIYVRNISQEFVTVNNALAEFLGTSEEVLVKYRMSDQAPFSTSMNMLAAKDYDVFISKRPVIIEDQQLTHAGTGVPMWWQTIKVPLTDDSGKFTEVLSVSMDITEIKTKERELAQLNDRLEHMVFERTALLESANKELETFNYSVSHDLRTPLRSIDIFAYFLEKNHKTQLDRDGAENIRQIRRGITKMSALIDNLLIFSKIGRGDLKKDLIQVNDLIHAVVGEMTVHDQLPQYQFIISQLHPVPGDYAMVRQAFINIIHNAIKFSQTKKDPLIEISSLIESNTVIYKVRDNGVGFSMEFRDKLFKPFKRLHSDEEFEGTGVGLAIVERIAKRHDGEVWAESTEGLGTTFFLKLPL